MFRNREDAGLQLAALLRGRQLTDPLVLGIPRGGVVLGAILARELLADLDVVLSRKLRAPGNPELALGAVGETGEVFLQSLANQDNPQLEKYLEEERQYQLQEIARRRQLFRGDRPAAPLEGRSVILTDDGIATGSTMIAALQVARTKHSLELVVAVPVGAVDRLEMIRPLCDDIVCVLPAEDLYAIGQYYEDFTQVEDEEVVELLHIYGPAPQEQS
jgi:putative phosphoribosyl transferase